MADGSEPSDAVPVPAVRGRALRRRLAAAAFHPDVPILGVWLALAVTLAAITYRIADWFKLPDEMVFQRLGISIWRDHSLVPRIHGEFVRSLDQLYPLLIAPIVGNGYVSDDLTQIRVLNAFLITSACIPAYLLARRVSGRRWVGYLVAVLSICLPWITIAPFILTEVVAYPAFLWAILAIQRALVRPSARTDLVALGAISVAFFARTQLVGLLGVLPLAILAYEVPRDSGIGLRKRVAETVRAAVARHRLLIAVFAVAATAAAAFELAGGRLLSLSIYSEEFNRSVTPTNIPGGLLAHIADLAFGIGILPFVVGAGWLLANVVRPAATAELQAFACIGTAAVLLMTYEVTTFDLQLGGFIFDRYLFYLVPLLLLAFTCALLDESRPRWSLALPVAAVALGFVLHLQGSFTWDDQYGRVNSDTPISILYKPIVDLAGGRGWASAGLAAGTIALAALFLAGAARLRQTHLAAGLLVLLAVLLPADTGYGFHRLLDTIGYSERPLTQRNAGELDWVDRTLSTRAAVTIVPYPVSSAYLVTQKYWRDIEFWNKSVTKDLLYPSPDVYTFTGMWFPKTVPQFNPDTGAVSVSPTRWVVQSINESRFRIAGNERQQTDQAMLIDAGDDWHLAWLTSGLYDDGWTRPGVTAHVRLYPAAGQVGAVAYSLGLQLRATDDTSRRPVLIVSNLARRRFEVSGGTTTLVPGVLACVPAHGFADVLVSTPRQSAIPGDQKTYADSQATRLGGILVADLFVSDNTQGRCTPAR
jgi:hypothetical protein